jgi:pilus assembly protein Flp/PilA
MMQQIWTLTKKLFKKDEGASLAEYGLLMALIAVVCVAAVTTLGTTIKNYLSSAAAAF